MGKITVEAWMHYVFTRCVLCESTSMFRCCSRAAVDCSGCCVCFKTAYLYTFRAPQVIGLLIIALVAICILGSPWNNHPVRQVDGSLSSDKCGYQDLKVLPRVTW